MNLNHGLADLHYNHVEEKMAHIEEDK